MLRIQTTNGAPAQRCISLAVLCAVASAHCGQSVYGIDPDPTIRDPFPSADGAVIVIPFEAGAGDAGLTDASPFVGLDGRVRSDDTRSGVVTVSSTLFGGSISNNATAGFFRRERDRVCAAFSDGEYFFADCPDAEEPDGETIPRAHAGRIDVRNTRATIGRLSPDSQGSYPSSMLLDSALSPGTELTVTAMGAEVPAFEGQLRTPGVVGLRLESPAGNVVRTTEDVALRWNPMSGERITVVVNREYTGATGDRRAYVGASYATAVGAARIPPRVLRRLAATGMTTSMLVYATVENRTEVRAGQWPILLRALRTEVIEDARFER
jgi:hypothetical protein